MYLKKQPCSSSIPSSNACTSLSQENAHTENLLHLCLLSVHTGNIHYSEPHNNTACDPVCHESFMA